ncbi:hypothetical protein KO509_07545, partial [Colwellia sp. C2M11]|uniref:FimV/HubP family polar landmark protein n=1 Tax=Colwellia sp. C2M11 TaxID=2841566 RepID=UPI0025B17D73
DELDIDELITDKEQPSDSSLDNDVDNDIDDKVEDELIADDELDIDDLIADMEQSNDSSIDSAVDSEVEDELLDDEDFDIDELIADLEKSNETPMENEVEDELIDDEDFDIDELIADMEQSTESPVEDKLDIGDDLVSGAFDKQALEELLEDNEHAIELSPDFSDQNVLADLLNDSDEDSSSKVTEASEINDIKELNNLNFDELLANIEEESSIANQGANFNENLDDSDKVTLEDFDNFNSQDISSKDSAEAGNFASSDSNESDFVSVDSLLSDSQGEVNFDEPYENANIDVGLNEFPEFTRDVNLIDVDIDESGMAAKLDLAKVYLEIGDEDNAQVILKEVIKLGTAEQQEEAQRLLNES